MEPICYYLDLFINKAFRFVFHTVQIDASIGYVRKDGRIIQIILTTEKIYNESSYQ